MIENVSNENFKILNKLSRGRNLASRQSSNLASRHSNPYLNKQHEAFDVLIEGKRLISQVLEFGLKIKSLYIKNDKIESFNHLIDKCQCPTYSLTEKQANILTETKSLSGIFALVSFQTQPIKNFNKLLYLNKISDPGNLGSIIRTASVFDIDGIVLDDGCCDISNSKVIRASLGAVFVVPMLKVDEFWLQERTEKLFIAHSSKGISINEINFDSIPYIIILGSEAHGVSTDINNLSHQKVHISMQGKMQSLNVAMAAGLFMYEMNKT